VTNQARGYVAALALFLPGVALGQGTDEDKFRRCVEIKDLTLSIAAAADRGVSREELKARVNHRASVVGLVDLVFDFRGAMSNQELAARQMNNCLKVSGFKESR
jgi:hypothetical protein